MDFNSLTLSPIFEKSLIRLVADFGSDLDPKSASSSLSKSLNIQISSKEPSKFSYQLTRTSDGVYHFTTSFILHKNARLVIINFLQWIAKNGFTKDDNSFLIDLKFVDKEEGPFKGTLFNTSTKIDNINKLKFLLEFDENKMYNKFPNRKYGFISKTINNFTPLQKFIPKESDIIEPMFYSVPNTSNCGVNFEMLLSGFIRLQYIGGNSYETKINSILDILNYFTFTAWDTVLNPRLNKANIDKFEKIVKKTEFIRDSYIDYDMFNKKFPNITLSVDLVTNKTVLKTSYTRLRDSIYNILTGLKFDGKLNLNYDSTFAIFQIRDAKIKGNNCDHVEFIKCDIQFGSYTKCEFYDCKIKNTQLDTCNLFLDSVCENSEIINCVSNRTTTLINCSVSGENSVINGKMENGIFKNGKIGEHTKFNNTTVIQYQKLKAGYLVASDKVIIPTTNYKTT